MRKPESHITYSWECKKVWGSEPSHSQGNSHFVRWSPDGLPKLHRAISRSKLNGLWHSLYRWKALGTLISKMGLYYSFKYLKHKLWPKERPGIKLSVWLSTTKVRNRPDVLICRRCVTYRWKALNESYNFALDCISIGGLLAKLWGSKVVRVLTWAILGLPLGSLGTKSHLDVGSVANHRVYYKGEGVGFPKVQAVVSLVCSCYMWFVLEPKMFQLGINHLVWVFVHAHVSEWSLSTLPSFIPELQHAPLPLKVLWAKEHAPIPPFSVVFYLNSHLSPSKS